MRKKKSQTCCEATRLCPWKHYSSARSSMLSFILELVALFTQASLELMLPTVCRMSRQSVQELHIIQSQRSSSLVAIFARPSVRESMMKNSTFFSGSFMNTSRAIAFDLRATHLSLQIISSLLAFRARMEWRSRDVIQGCARKLTPRNFHAFVTVHVASQFWGRWLIYSVRAVLINAFE